MQEMVRFLASSYEVETSLDDCGVWRDTGLFDLFSSDDI
ncbi:hypothetical protein LRHMDP2_1396 [Lacticaseibacillus rhamnosus LRHMDP2]|uniref:Uncharacterized protein n=1 Tax=Lacticaseibacillus rhamnosus LRHMDP3 TaxID=1203259 RepID=A0AB33XV06_LACRH|nr:hypothetical protein LRHMDP3_1452 [Lacticaseibacillus rhamnosus LRHMDP3]EKS51614.1 hypothetical protein LRHMDP2_1396 [Lacticaseibacillus rhamnosus LRHMDP2]